MDNKKKNAYADALRFGRIDPPRRPMPSGEACKRCGKEMTDIEYMMNIFCGGCLLELRRAGIGVTDKKPLDENEFGF